MDHARAQARLHKLEQILVPRLAESVERNVSDPGPPWRSLNLDEAQELVEELADPELGPARREAILGDVRARVSPSPEPCARTPRTPIRWWRP